MIKKENLVFLVTTKVLSGLDFLSLDDERLSMVLINEQEETWSMEEESCPYKIGQSRIKATVKRSEKEELKHDFFIVGVYDRTNNEHLKKMCHTVVGIAEDADDYYRDSCYGSFCFKWK